MMFEDAQDAWELYNISPELTCTCDEFHTCQQCHEEDKASEDLAEEYLKPGGILHYQVYKDF